MVSEKGARLDVGGCISLGRDGFGVLRVYSCILRSVPSPRTSSCKHADRPTAVVSAPLVEELAEGLALVIFFLWKRDEFDNVLDGIIYAAMAGLWASP